jgi:L-ascorbate metabolism protein UlaG (beta-lactamase superfamily)
MHLSWYGENCFKIQTKAKRGDNDTIIVTDPFNKKIGLRPPQGQTNIITLSNINYAKNDLKRFKGEPFTIDSAGEYSIKGVNITGIESFQDDKGGELRGRNTIFTIESEGIRVCHLGNIGHVLNEEQVDNIGEVDILLIPVGREDLLTLKQIKEIIGQLEPGIIIPMNYKVKGLKDKINGCQDFCKEFGSARQQGETKLVIKEKNVKDLENNLVVLKVS